MSGWQRCDACRKVRTGAEFDAGATTCRPCLSGPAPSVRKRAAPVVTSRSAPPARTAPAAGPRRPLVGAVGSGDLEVRERRARRVAHEALEQSHPDEYRLLLRDARAAEGLRAMDPGPPPRTDTGDTSPFPPGAAD